MDTFGKVIFSQGVYVGEVVNGKANGYGRIKFNNGDTYLGQWSNNCMSGIGLMDTKNYTTLGQFLNGKRHGDCLTIYKRGSYIYDFYIGKYVNNLKCGKGAYYWNNEDCYYGDFANDRSNGKGFISRFGGNSFFGGTYKDAKCIDGGIDFPKTVLPNGDTFYGDCNKHYFCHGFGLLVNKQGNARYMGYHNKLGPNMTISYNFNGVKIGGNRIRVGAHSKYLTVGDWGTSTIRLNGKFDKIYENGNMYSGHYLDGNKNGYGIYYDGQFISRGLGSIYIGKFSNGKMIDGVEVSSSFLLIAKGSFSSSTSKGYKLYDSGELMTFENGSKSSRMIGFEPYEGVLNGEGNVTSINNKSNINLSIDSNSNDEEDYEEDPPIIDFYKAEQKAKYLEKVLEEAKIWEKEKKERLERERKEKEAQLAKEKKRREIEEKIKQAEIERLKEKYYLSKDLSEIIRCTHKIEEKYHMIPEGITMLGNKSFINQYKVEKIVGPTTLKTIGESAFAYSSSIKEIDLSVTSINGLGGKCFVDCVNLETLMLPDTIKEVSIDNFHNCNKINKIIFPSKEMSFKEFVDLYCYDKDKKFSKYYYFNESKYYILGIPFKTPALYNFTDILEVDSGDMEEIIIPVGYHKILNNAFKKVSKYVKKLVILYPYIKLEIDALKGLNKLIELDLSETKLEDLTNINLSHCTSLDILRLPDTLDLDKCVNEIANCESLTKIYHQGKLILVKNTKEFTNVKKESLEKTKQEIKQDKTEEKKDSKLVVQDKNIVFLAKKQLKDSHYKSNNILKSIDLSKCDNNIIPKKCFEDCSELEKVILPKNLDTISKDSFRNCFKLETINFNLDNSLIIDEAAFLTCISLNEVHINATSIGDKAFYNCKSLEKITIDSKNEEIKMGSEVFCYCYNLKELIAPQIKKFSNIEFYKCSKLKKIVVHRKCKIDKKFLKRMLEIDGKISITKKGMTKIISIE